MYKLAEDVLGRRIRCDYIYDVFDSTGKIDESARHMVGVCGTVESVDNAGQLHVKWDNGSTLAINPEVDKFAILEGSSPDENELGKQAHR